MNKINRTTSIEFRSLEGEERTIEGYASVFDQETDLGYFYEKIDRHAFDNCDMSDVYLLMNHDSNLILAGTQNGSLELSVDDKGLKQRASVVDTTNGNDYLQLVKEGLIRKMSFGFTIDRDHGEEWWTDDDRKEHRTIKKIDKLFDVSIVTYPAYEGTSVRSIDELDELAKDHLERRNAQMEEKEVLAEEVRETEEVVEVAPVESVEEELVLEEKAEETEEKAEEPMVEEPKEERKMNTNFDNVSVRNNEDYRSSVEYRRAWVNAIIGDAKELNAFKEERGLSTASATLVPTYIADKIQHTWEANKLINEVSVILSSAKLSFPVETSSTGASFHAEGGEAIAEEELTLVDVLLQPMTIKKYLSVTTELIDSGEEAIMDYIAEEIAYHIIKLASDSVINGQLQSGKGVEGVVNSALANAVSGGTLDATTIYKGLATLVDVAEPVAVMNPTDFYGEIMGLMDTTGRPIFSQYGAEKFVNGCRVILSSAVPNNKIIVGDLKAFKLEMESREPRFVFDPYTSAREDKVNVVGRLLVAGRLVKKNKIAVVTYTA